MGSGASKPEKDEIAKAITGKERPVDAVDSVDGRTMLHSAVLAGDVEAVRFLVENGAGNVRDRDGKVPLWYALQHRDADVRGRLGAELGAHAAQILVEVEDAVQVYLTDGVATTTTTARTPTTPGVAVERSSGDATTAPLTDPHMDMAEDTNTSTGDRHLGEDDLDGDTGALWHTDGRKVEFLQKTDDNNNNKNSNGGEDLLCWLRGLPKVDPPLGYTDEHVRHMEAGFRVVCKRLLEDMRGRREAAGTRGGHVEVEDWMAARDPFELLLSGFLFTSDCVEYVLDSGGDVVCDEKDGTPQIAKGPDGKLRYIRLTERAVLGNHGSAADSQSLALYMTMNTAMRAVGQLAAVKEWKGTPEKTAPNVFELCPAPPQLHVIETFAPLIRGLDRLIGSRRKQLRTVFRGINVNVSAKYALNTHIVWNCFTSTTLKRDVARSFMYGKGGTFFVVVAKEGAADVKFSSVYASEDELLYTANIEYRVQWKLSPTLLRMMGLRFDVIVMQEVCSGVGVGETSAAEQVGALQEVMGHTVAFFEDYLAQYVEGRVGDDTRVDESETRPLMEEVRRWLRARGGGGGGGKQMSSVCTQAAASTERKPDVEAREERQGTCGVLCVIGEGGSGKTSASIAILSDLATSARKSESTRNEDTTANTNRNRNSVVSDVTADADAKPYFPVFVALPTVKQHLLEKGGLDRFVLESFALREADRAFLAETYEVVLVLDSLDEVGLTQEDVGAVVAEGGLLCRHPWVEAHCSVVVTVRGEYLKGVDTSPSGVCGAGVRALYMQPFTEVDARTYIKRANTAWEKEKEHKEEKEKEKSAHKEERTVFVREEDVEGLVQLRNPFVLHMACHAQCSGKASEEVIYETYLETWTKKEMASGGVAVAVGDAVSDVSLEDVVRAGELVACRMLETNEWQGTVGVASEVLDSQHGVCEAVRDACFRCLPFRIEDFGEERSAFTFRHKSLGEHLAARRLARDPAGTLGTLVQRSFSKDSQRVLGFFAALVCGDSVLYERACTELLAAVKATRGSAGVVAGGDAGVGGEGAVTAGSNAAALLARARIPVSGEDLSGIRVSNCDLRGSLFVETVLTGASFSNCWLEHTEFHTCDMGGTMLPDCSLGTPLPVLQHDARDMAVSTDGSQMLTVGKDGSVHVWSMSSGEEVMVLEGHSLSINGVAVTPDGTRVVSCSADRTVRVWDMHTGEAVFVLKGHVGPVFEVAVTPDSSKIVSTSPHDGIRVWDLSTGMEVLAMKSELIRSMVITKDGSQIVTCSGEVLCVWDLVTGKQEMQWPCCVKSSHALAVTPDGCHVVSCCDDAHLWNLSTGAEVMVFHAEAQLLAVAVTPDGCHVVAGSKSGNVHVWSISTGKEVTVLQGHTANVTAVAVSPDGCHVVSCSDDKTVRVWNITTGKETPGFERFSGGSVAVAPDGSIISYGGKRNSIWNASTGRQTQVLEARMHKNGDDAAAVSPDGSHVVYCSCDDAGERRACVWDVATGNVQPLCIYSSEFAVFLKQCGKLRTFAVSPDASHVVTCSQTSQEEDTFCTYVWSMPTGKKVSEYAGTTWGSEGVVVSPDGVHVVSHSADTTVHMWKLHTGEETMVFKGHTEFVNDITVTRDGSRLVSCSYDETVRVWDVASGKAVFTLQHSYYVNAVALTPDGAHVVSLCGGSVSVWSMTTGEKVAEIRAHCRLHNVAVSPDGREVISNCEDNTVRVWTICTGEDGTIDGLRLKRVIGVPQTVPRVFGCRNADAVEPELARRILCAGRK